MSNFSVDEIKKHVKMATVILLVKIKKFKRC